MVKTISAYKLDLRALSLMRIAIALIVIVDLCIRFADLEAHYTDDGIWPSSMALTLAWKPYSWSIHTLFGSYAWAFLLFLLHFVFATLLLLGYKSRLSTIVVWLLTISLHNRNLFVLQAGDDLLRLLLFWGVFLPWNAYFSLDSLKTDIKPKPSMFANLAYLILIASVYFFTACLKTSKEWHSEGSAIYYALSLDQMRLPGLGNWLYQFPSLMKFLTHVVYFIELAIPLFVLFPSKNGHLRGIGFILIVLLNIGIGSTLYVGLFFLINIAGALALLPAYILNRVFEITAPKLKIQKRNSVLLSVKNSALSIVIALCLTINLGKVNWFSYELKPEIWYPVNALRLDQYWAMFSPSVMKKDGWFVYYGMDSIGKQWDLRLNKDNVDFKKPSSVVSMYSSDRWRKLAENMQGNDFTFLRPRYCKYVLKQWNKNHPEKKISTLNLYFMEKENKLNYTTSPLIKNLHCVCNDF